MRSIDRDVTLLHSYRFRGGEAYIGHDGLGRRACDPGPWPLGAGGGRDVVTYAAGMNEPGNIVRWKLQPDRT